MPFCLFCVFMFPLDGLSGLTDRCAAALQDGNAFDKRRIGEEVVWDDRLYFIVLLQLVKVS